ncbi:MAG TPA: hypothetical protein VLT88_05190 [Desulfosarcina sp.]|nr:hypothetical protein [Desulfosarcina sp.]
MKIRQPALCIRCAGIGNTCCQGREIYITPGDRRRIGAVAKGVDFAVWTRPTDAAYADQDDDPLWRRHVFHADGSRRTLKTASNGNCIFLGVHGCRLGPAVRPLLCRLHPFTYTAGHLDDEPDGGCPRHLLPEGRSVFAATGTARSRALHWHRQLYEEIQVDGHEDWKAVDPVG